MRPNSAAMPLRPRYMCPSTTIPPPRPVPTVIITTNGSPRPAPKRASPHAAAVASFSTNTRNPPPFSTPPPRGGVRVVLHHHRQPAALLDRLAQRLPAPGQVGGEEHRGALGVDEPGRGEPHRLDVAALGEVADDVGDGLLDLARVGGGRVPAGGGGDLAVLVHQPRSDLGASDVDTDGQTHGASLPGSRYIPARCGVARCVPARCGAERGSGPVGAGRRRPALCLRTGPALGLGNRPGWHGGG